MKKLLSCVLIACVLLPLSRISPAVTAMHKLDTELTAIIQRLVDAQRAFDADAMSRLLADDYVEVSPVGEVDERAKVLGFYSPEAKAKATGAPAVVEVTDVIVRPYQDYASVIAKLTFVRKMGDAENRVAMRATFLCRKEQDRWVISTAQYTGIRQPPQTKS